MDTIDDKLNYLVENGTGSSGAVYYLGIGTSFNIKEKFPNDYTNLINENFIVEPYEIYGTQNSGGDTNPSFSYPFLYTKELTYSKSYNSSTGILEVKYGGNIIGGTKNSSSGANTGINYTHNISTSFKAYLVLSDIELA